MHVHTWTARAQLHNLETTLEQEKRKTAEKRAIYEQVHAVLKILDDLEGGAINRRQARSRARQVGINV